MAECIYTHLLELPLSLGPFCLPVAAAVTAVVRFQHGAPFFAPIRERSGHGKFDIIRSALNSEFWHGTQSKDTQHTRWLLSLARERVPWGGVGEAQTRAPSILTVCHTPIGYCGREGKGFRLMLNFTRIVIHPKRPLHRLSLFYIL